MKDKKIFFMIVSFLIVFCFSAVNYVKSSSIISISPDGSVIGTENLVRQDNVYTFSGNIQGSLIIEKSDIVIDGQGYSLQGSDNQGYGIELVEKNDVTITNLKIIDYSTGIFVRDSSNCVFSDNHLENYHKGIKIISGSNNTISNNDFISNLPFQGQTVLEHITRKGTAITLASSSTTRIFQNHIQGNMFGMELETSSTNEIFDNIIENNDYGIVTRTFNNNQFYHNSIIGNSLQIFDWSQYDQSWGSSENVWDKGYLVGGNFWDSYVGDDEFSGVNQIENCNDGIIDTYYQINEKNEDSYPLANPWQDHLNPPVVRFSNSPVSVNALEEVTFSASDSYDLDENIASYQWDFDDGNITTTTSSTIKHAFSNPRKYDVELKIIDEKNLYNVDSQSIQVIATSHFSITAISRTTSIGFAVDVKGSLNSMFNEPIEGQTVVFSYTFAGANQWIPITSASTDDEGKFSITWTPTATGEYSIRAEWNGNGTYASASYTTNLNILFQDDEHLFSVESNSTLTGLSFDSTSNELSFTTNGVTDTNGFVRILISKSILSEVANVQVFIDNQKVDFTTSEIDESWIVQVTYPQSTHSFNILLSGSVLGFDNSSLNFVIIGIVLVILAVLGFVLVKKRF